MFHRVSAPPNFGVLPAPEENPAPFGSFPPKGKPALKAPKAPKAPKESPSSAELALYEDNPSTGGFPPSACMAPLKKEELLARNRAKRAAARAVLAARAARLALYGESFTTGLKPPEWCWAPVKTVLGKSLLKRQNARRNLLLLMQAV